MSSSSSKKKLNFENDEVVLCYHGPLLYEAKVLKGEYWEAKEGQTQSGPHYFVHYKGWKVKWDEWVPEIRIMKKNEANLQKKKDLQALQKGDRQKDERGLERKDRSDDKNKRIKFEDKKEKFDIQLAFPEKLINFLVDDWELITKKQMLVTLPREPTVSQVLDQYYAKKTEKNPNHILKEMLDGLKVYFDVALGKMLLYRFERQQYVQIRKENGKDSKMSDIYGTEHLLRLLVKIQQLIPTVSMEVEAINTLNENLNGILDFIHKNYQTFITEDYENATQEYLSYSKTF